MDSTRTPFTRYQKRLFVFLSVATFFEGYDLFAFTQILPDLRRDMGLSELETGLLMTAMNVGTVVAYLLVRMADRWGRRRLLTLTIVGYTTFTFLTGLAPDAVWFGVLQFIARTFLIAEWATSIVYAAEEYPAERRGMVIGVISAASSLGGIVCAGVAPLLRQVPVFDAPEERWRLVYFIGIVPLVILAIARRNLRETRRYAELGPVARRSIFHILGTPYRKRMLLLAVIWGLTYVCTQNAVSVWKDFAIGHRGLSDGQAGLAIVIAALVSAPLIFAVGKLLDVVGRKRGAAVVFVVLAVGVYLAYTVHGRWPLTLALIAALFGASAFLPVLNAFTTELFPTELRGDAFAWTNNLLGRIPYVISPALVGALAHGDWSGPVRVTVLFPLAALVLILLFLPETTRKELEETAKL